MPKEGRWHDDTDIPLNVGGVVGGSIMILFGGIVAVISAVWAKWGLDRTQDGHRAYVQLITRNTGAQEGLQEHPTIRWMHLLLYRTS